MILEIISGGSVNPVTQAIWKGSQQAPDIIRFAFLKNHSWLLYAKCTEGVTGCIQSRHKITI